MFGAITRNRRQEIAHRPGAFFLEGDVLTG